MSRGISDIFPQDSVILGHTKRYFIKMPEPQAKASWAKFDKFTLGVSWFYGLYHDQKYVIRY